jgi:carboxypeptidase C (cathepsin A)
VDVPDEGGHAGTPPYRLIANPHSLLGATDLVFVDPIGTGYSRALGDHEDKEFWTIDEDADTVARFIRGFLDEHRRWNSPVFVGGESYGGVRSVLVADRLHRSTDPLLVSGLILVAPALNFRNLNVTDMSNQDDFFPYVSSLPTFAAGAWLHHKLPDRPPELAPFVDEVREFAVRDYAFALLQGDRLDAAEARRIREQLHRYTGLDPEYLAGLPHLRVTTGRFLKELLRDENKILSWYDSRYVDSDFDAAGEQVSADVMSYSTGSAFSTAITVHLQRNLGVEMDGDYRGMNYDYFLQVEPPEYQTYSGGWLDVTPELIRLMRQNPALRIFAALGYYDNVVPFYSVEYTLEHLYTDAKRITVEHYPAGHMPYLHKPSQLRLSRDVENFIRSRTSTAQPSS